MLGVNSRLPAYSYVGGLLENTSFVYTSQCFTISVVFLANNEKQLRF